jgi:hypothetical protein
VDCYSNLFVSQLYLFLKDFFLSLSITSHFVSLPINNTKNNVSLSRTHSHYLCLSHTLTHTHTYSRTHKHTRTHTHTHTHTHTQTRTEQLTQTHRYMQTFWILQDHDIFFLQKLKAVGTYLHTVHLFDPLDKVTIGVLLRKEFHRSSSFSSLTQKSEWENFIKPVFIDIIKRAI